VRPPARGLTFFKILHAQIDLIPDRNHCHFFPLFGASAADMRPPVAVRSMPLVRYFVFVGGMLLGLLFLADWYFPTSTVATTVADNDVDRSIIRIHSSHKWPAAIQMDTRAPMPATTPVVAEAMVPTAPAERVRQAYAFEPPPQKAPEKVRRRAKPSRPLARERGEHFANYQPPDSRGWPPAGW
jgi:hypothetical protein